MSYNGNSNTACKLFERKRYRSLLLYVFVHDLNPIKDLKLATKDQFQKYLNTNFEIEMAQITI